MRALNLNPSQGDVQKMIKEIDKTCKYIPY